MFFFLIDKLKNNVDSTYNIDIISTVAYLILYSYVPADLKFYFWAMLVIDALITFYKKTIFDKIDEIFEKKEDIEENEEKNRMNKKKEIKREKKIDNDLRTTKSGYFESALDEISFTKSSDLMIEKMIQDSKSF